MINLLQRLRHRKLDRFMYLMLARKANFTFARMNIYVDLVERNADQHDRYRKRPLHQSLGIPLKDSMLDDAVPHEALVDVNMKTS